MKPVQRAETQGAPSETVSEPPRAEYPKMSAQTAAKTSAPKPECPTGYDLLHNPRLNKGTAFTQEERRAWRLEGLLPPAVTTIDLQVARRHAEIACLADDLTEVPRTLGSAGAQRDALLRGPDVGPRHLHAARLHAGGRGGVPEVRPHLSPGARHVSADQRRWSAQRAPLQLAGKGRALHRRHRRRAHSRSRRSRRWRDGYPDRQARALYRLRRRAAAILSAHCSRCRHEQSEPLDDPLYQGLRQHRVRGEEYLAFVDEFVAAVQQLYPKCCIQWEDFANFNAVPILARYRDKICTFNDDVQGTAGIVLAGIFAALRLTGQKLTDQRFLFLGAGSAATGIAELISLSMARAGMDPAAARQRNPLFDINGLLVTSRTDLADFQKPFAQERTPISTFVEAVEALRPTGIIGLSTVPKLFSREVIEAMARINERPIVFPLSNPTSRSECTAEEAYRWSDGRAVFASGSPFPPVEIVGRRFIPGQGNNVYIFPAMGMAVFATEATRVTEDMFIIAAQAVAEQVTEENLSMGLIYPPQSRILNASLHVAERIAACIFEKGLARVPRPDDIGALIRARAYRPVYAA